MRAVAFFPLVPLALLGVVALAPITACSGSSSSDGGDGGAEDGGDGGGTTGGTSTGGTSTGGTTGGTATCTVDADCRAFPSHCDTCECLALGAKAPDPKCSGADVSCLLDPCTDKVAKCGASGACELRSK